ncbi:hypothetical protein ESZ50_09135, partial [Weissella muntiaci]
MNLFKNKNVKNSHFKMYKVGKFWVFSSMVLIALGGASIADNLNLGGVHAQTLIQSITLGNQTTTYATIDGVKLHDDIVVQNVLGATQSQLGDPIKFPGYVLNAGESTYTSFSATYKFKEYLTFVNGMADALGHPRVASAYDLIELFRSLGSIPNDTYAENSITLNYVYEKKLDQIDLQTHDVTIRIGDPLNVSSFITSIKTSDGTDGSIADVVNNLKDINTSVPGKYNVTLTYLDPDSLSSVKKVSQLTILPKDNVGSDNSGDNNTGNSNVGSDNSGNNNTGNSNVGSDNSGDHNTGNSNVGSDNSGSNNTGNSN